MGLSWESSALSTSLSPAEKRNFWAESRNYCSSLVLELFERPPELASGDTSGTH